LFSCPAKTTWAMRRACSLVTVAATQVTNNPAPEFMFSHSSLQMQRTEVANRHMHEKANRSLAHSRLRWGPLSGFPRLTACLLRDKYLGRLCPHSERVVLPCCFTRSFASSFCCTSSLPALPCGVGAEGGFCISYRLFSNISHPSSSAVAPRSDRATALQVCEEANHGHYPPLSDVCAPILHRSRSTVHCIFFFCIEIGRPTYKLTKRRSASATPPPSGVCATKLYGCR
jgi:hypothetical protein